jgi:hypothetical protein
MITRFANFISDLDGLWFLLSLILGVGVLGYVSVTWLVHLAGAGQYLVALGLAGLSLASVALALFRVPFAQIIVLGCAIVCGTAFLLGYGNVLLP